ncbi:hypothetical protein [Candidatus Magnetaquicoccus inordinatus]|uniref:hypothetical protein n=1 Tax=Candidatus Magnetaquicoccus inordinatus TaxID=2496818 RepID=UPI00102BB1FC|nr:hypothetical protein [Candidatus Magnetaquicoccus inordinatus]
MNKQIFAPLGTLLALLLALLAAAKPLAESAQWPDTWQLCLLAVLVAGGLNLLWRAQPQPLWAESISGAEESAAGATVSAEALRECIDALQQLHNAAAAMGLPAILHELEEIHSQWLLPLIHTRSSLSAGMNRLQRGRFLAELAAGELWLNRARSTAGDCYRVETQQAIIQALAQFISVQQLLAASR